MTDLKILLTASKGFLYQQATKAFARGHYEITAIPRPSVESVIERIELEKPDVILLDLSLPRVSGESLLALIREQSPKTIVVVEMKAMALYRSMNLVRSADAVVVEPYEPAELRMRVDTAVATRARPARPPLVAELHDRATGRINAKKLADYLGISLASLSNAIGKDYKAVFKTPASEPLQSALAPIHRTVVALHRYFGRREESLAWLNTANPEIEEKRPKDLILEGKAEIVADMLEGALAGVPA